MTAAVPLTVGVFLLAMGGYALGAPAALIEPFGLVADTPESRSEIRAVYGGFGLAIAAVLLLAVLHGGEFGRGVVTTVRFALAGMAAGRVASRFADRPTAFYPVWFYFCVETVAAALLLVTA